MYAIYLGVRDDGLGRVVLLTDGAFTEERNCYMREYGVVWHKPRLFVTRGGARNFQHRHGLTGKRYKVRKYRGAREPWDRATERT